MGSSKCEYRHPCLDINLANPATATFFNVQITESNLNLFFLFNRRAEKEQLDSF